MDNYLFDFDGTLVDSMPTWSRKVLRVLENHGIEYPDGILRILTPLGDIGAAAYFHREFGLEIPDSQIFAEMDEYALPRYRDEIPAKSGVAETIRALRAEGKRCSVLTASPHKMVDDCLRRNGLYDLFEKIWSCDDFYTTKADPMIYHKAADALGCRVDEIIFCDDNINAVRSAKSAGCRTVAVFDASSAGDEELMRATADRYIFTFPELLKNGADI